jgi:predicted house-cleaning noncanonical NTP pyrophosphatase (MazG superfamily)
MPTFRYAKLVRDNIWRWHEEDGHTVNGEVLKGAELQRALCDKLHEEADEVNGALSKDEMIEEIADVRQILDDLCREEGITEAEVQAAKDKKADKKGGFGGGYYIETVTMPDEDDRWVQYCRKDPEKYPEIVG